jgi:hypothetical protein
MAQTVSKRFSNVRYWRYVFTPLLFILFIFGIFILYTGDKAMGANFSSLRGALYRNINSASPSTSTSFGSTLNSLNKLRI